MGRRDHKLYYFELSHVESAGICNRNAKKYNRISKNSLVILAVS